MKDFYDLFIKELKDIYEVEKQIIKAFPEMAKAANSSKLKDAFNHHLKETKNQVSRLEEIAKELNEELKEVENEAIKGLLKEIDKIIRADFDEIVKDAALISAAQKVEHYEIACYGVLKSYAKHLNFKKIEEILEKSSEEEGHANKKLTSIAKGNIFITGINEKAKKHAA